MANAPATIIAGLIIPSRDPLFLGAFAFALVALGRQVARRGGDLRIHASAMCLSYIVLLTVFYVDNGKNLPVWRDLPVIAYWTLPALIGVPLILRVLVKHSLLRRQSRANSS
jgi:hypothetical protein